MHDLVSVIIPTRNRATLLERAVLSVLGQTFQKFEIIIIDDASSDSTQKLLVRLARQDSRIRIIRHSSASGGAAARNAGIAASSGRWVSFLDDDDIWLPEKLETQIDVLNNNPGTMACTCSYRVFMPFGCKHSVHPPADVSLDILLQANIMGGASTCMCAGESLKRIGGFDEQLPSAQDWDLWIQLRLEGKIVSCNKVLVHYDSHFGPRITRNNRSRYAGLRKIYFKYRHLMDEHTRRINIARLCYSRSRLPERETMRRLGDLGLAIKKVPAAVSAVYILSSFPRIIASIIKRWIRIPG